MQESCFIYDHSSLVKPSFISELNKFLPKCCSVSNFSEKKIKKPKIILATNQKRFFIKKSTEKSELLVQMAKVSRQKTDIMDQKTHNFQLTKIGNKLCRNKDRKWQEPKYAWKIQKNPVKFSLEGLLFSIAIKNETERIFVTVHLLIFNPWKVPWNWIAFSQNSFVISPGLLYHLIRRDTGQLANEVVTANSIVSSRK